MSEFSEQEQIEPTVEQREFVEKRRDVLVQLIQAADEKTLVGFRKFLGVNDSASPEDMTAELTSSCEQVLTELVQAELMHGKLQDGEPWARREAETNLAYFFFELGVTDSAVYERLMLDAGITLE